MARLEGRVRRLAVAARRLGLDRPPRDPAPPMRVVIRLVVRTDFLPDRPASFGEGCLSLPFLLTDPGHPTLREALPAADFEALAKLLKRDPDDDYSFSVKGA